MRRPPIDAFDLALGVYAGAVVLVTATAATGRGLFTRLPFVAAIAALLVVSGVAASRTDPDVWPVERRLHSVLGFAPTAPLLAVMVGASFGVISFSATLGWLRYLLPPAVAGLVVGVVAMRCYVAHVRVLVEWNAEPDARYKWGVRAAWLVGAVVVIVGSFVTALEFETETTFLASFGGVFVAYALVTGRERQYALFESGLVVRRSGALGEAFVPLERLHSIARSDHALTIHRRLPWPIPFRCSIATLRDPDAVESMLRERLE
ncbi:MULTISPECIES: hypothetical protein [Halococcus]|uniref:DUF5673 domain-containing protein n=1 Tax=Halococcus salifodinae DSM 8989 TaxID=1227456 RepID=M0N8G1_9EURY|nr:MULTISPECIES: hypothetical protein [Halococcus]EMA53389.1 hypothetical protein C450_08752 [Halococcus salifodinae DSM 8989]